MVSSGELNRTIRCACNAICGLLGGKKRDILECEICRRNRINVLDNALYCMTYEPIREKKKYGVEIQEKTQFSLRRIIR